MTARRILAAVAALTLTLAACGGVTASGKYASCDEARKAGKAPLHKGDEGYSSKLDRDGDGVACS